MEHVHRIAEDTIQVTSLDWLSCSYIMALTDDERIFGHAHLNEPPGMRLVECAQGTPQYRRRVIVQTERGDKLLTLLLEPHSSIIDSRSMFVEYSNPTLYDPAGLDWLQDIITVIHPGWFQSLSRIDIATDFHPSPGQMSIITSLQQNTAYVAGKREGAGFHNYTRPAGGGRVTVAPKQLGWGSKYSSVKWKLYNKTREITEVDKNGRTWCTKPYIPEKWTSAGLVERPVWRLEASITGASTYDWRGERLDWTTTNPEYYTQLFWDLYSTRFVIRSNDGHKCSTNDKQLNLLEPPDKPVHRIRERVSGKCRESVELAASLRACIKELDKPEISLSPIMRETWLRTANDVIKTGNLEGYFLRAFGRTFDQYASDLRSQ